MGNSKRTSPEEIIKARQELVELGLLEDSGERRRGADETLAIVWRFAPLAELLVEDYRRSGLTLDQALAKATAAMNCPH